MRRYASVDPQLYDAALNLCVEKGNMCMAEMMRIDARGGLGLAGIYNLRPLEYDKYARRGSRTVLGPLSARVGAICTTDEGMVSALTDHSAAASPPNAALLSGAGLPVPGRSSRAQPAIAQASPVHPTSL